MDNEEKIKELEEENIILKQKLDDKTTQLNKYLLKNTNYYETHKEEHKQNVKEFQRHPSFTCETLAGVSKTIGNEKIAY